MVKASCGGDGMGSGELPPCLPPRRGLGTDPAAATPEPDPGVPGAATVPLPAAAGDDPTSGGGCSSKIWLRPSCMLRDICSLMGTPAVAVPVKAVRSDEVEACAGESATGVTATSRLELISGCCCSGCACISFTKLVCPR